MTPGAGDGRVEDRLRIGLVAVSYGLFDEGMPADYRARRAARAEEVAARLGEFGDVLFPGVIDSEQAAIAAAGSFGAASIEALVFFPTMAAPPSYAWEVIRSVPSAPVLALLEQDEAAVPEDYDTEQATERSAPVGLVMLTNLFVRNARKAEVLCGHVGSDTLWDRVSSWLRGVQAAGSVRRHPLLSVGRPIAGYLDVEASEAQLERLGVAVVEVGAAELSAAFSGVSDHRAHAFVTELGSKFDRVAVGDAQLDRAARLTLALRDLCDASGAAGGTVNCHSDVLRWNQGVGTTACLGVACLTAEGRPFSCTGDIPTAIALCAMRKIAGAALYCELYQVDSAGDWVLVANGGEGDVSWREPNETVRLLPEDHYEGDHGAGVAVAWALPEGPASLVSLTPSSDAEGWRLVSADGVVIGSRHHAMDGPNAMFRFSSAPAWEAFERWASAGATHHAALVPGLQALSVDAFCQALGIHHVRI